KQMKRAILSLVALIALTLATSSVWAQSPHFVGTPACTKSLDTGLTCSGKAAGLANGPTVAFLTADSVNATYVCVNKGGNVAPGQPIVVQSVTAPTQTIAPHNGQITFSPTIPPPTPPSPSTECPNGNWRVVLTSLTFTNVVLHIQQPPGADVLTD